MFDISKRLGFLPQLPDLNDHCFAPRRSLIQNLPRRVDIRNVYPTVWDQGEAGSCVAHGSGFSHVYDQITQNEPVFMPSRLFLYYNCRVIENTVESDAGAVIRDAFKSIANQGVCPENLWGYDLNRFAEKPPDICYTEGVKHTSIVYESVSQDVNHLMACIAAKRPVVFGFTVYDSFDIPQVFYTGNMVMPKKGERNRGGHCVAAVGYNQSTKTFFCRNSWSAQWGDRGYFYMPFSFIEDPALATDFWCMKSIS